KAVELFQREADVLKTLNHPGIPKVEKDGYFIYFPRDSQQPLHCLVMEKIEGMDLYQYMKKRDFRPIKQKLAVEWLKKIVDILQLVHDNNFFHRDIKPPNIMLRTTGDLSLIDFGAAREATQTYYFAQQQGNVTGLISVGYTPIEQMSGKAVPQSDFFALGRTFVFLLTGKEPLDPAIFNSYNGEINWRDVVPNILPKFADLIDRMMGRLPSQRPADTREILQVLTEIEQGLNLPQRSSPQPLAEAFPATVQAVPSTPQQNTQNSTLYSANPQPTIKRKFWLRRIVAHFVQLNSPKRLAQTFPPTVQAAPSTPQQNIKRKFWLWRIIANFAQRNSSKRLAQKFPVTVQAVPSTPQQNIKRKFWLWRIIANFLNSQKQG
ncbi:MAG: serine/threonine-protein kinase, partial [Cyanobacteria bacterium P01_D01_bin.116]